MGSKTAAGRGFERSRVLRHINFIFIMTSVSFLTYAKLVYKSTHGGTFKAFLGQFLAASLPLRVTPPPRAATPPALRAGAGPSGGLSGVRGSRERRAQGARAAAACRWGSGRTNRLLLLPNPLCSSASSSLRVLGSTVGLGCYSPGSPAPPCRGTPGPRLQPLAGDPLLPARGHLGLHPRGGQSGPMAAHDAQPSPSSLFLFAVAM